MSEFLAMTAEAPFHASIRTIDPAATVAVRPVDAVDLVHQERRAAWLRDHDRLSRMFWSAEHTFQAVGIRLDWAASDLCGIRFTFTGANPEMLAYGLADGHLAADLKRL